jgi:hypothetical protein
VDAYFEQHYWTIRSGREVRVGQAQSCGILVSVLKLKRSLCNCRREKASKKWPLTNVGDLSSLLSVQIGDLFRVRGAPIAFKGNYTEGEHSHEIADCFQKVRR